jgi:alpha-beta hydrolase superfamily lysophospholipase
MGAESQLRQGPDEANGLAEAVYFDSGDHRLFGWMHHPSGDSVAALGIVICKPFGYEAICSHRGIRGFAESLAAAGLPALRFDYLGTGDSPEIDPKADQIQVWARDVVAAAAELRRRTGVPRVCFLGVRLGGLLAMLASAECTASGLVLISPIVSGRRYLRELRTTRMAGAAMAGSGAPADDGAEAGSMEVSGYTFSAATLASLGKLDFTLLPPPQVPDMLVIDGESMPVAKRWAESLSPRAGRTEYRALPGLVEMVMTAPQFAVVPGEMIAAARDWAVELADRSRAASDLEIGRVRDCAPARNTVLRLAEGSDPDSKTITERPVFLGRDGLVFGIVTEPRSGETRRRAVILLNTGADYHIGASRLYVSFARRWAYRGYIVLRMDLAGLGDSRTRPGCPDNDVFPPEALEDIRAAIEFLRTRYGVRDCTLSGLCSGAYHALRAAAAGVPVNRILMVNPQHYFWNPGDTLEMLQLAEIVKNPGVYRERMFSIGAWKRLLSGEVNILRILRIYMQRPLLAVESTARDIARMLRIKLPNDLGSELEEIVARGIRVVFIFADGDPGIDLLKLQAGASVRRLGERCRIHVIDNADHVFTQSGPRAVMEKVLSEELFAHSDWTVKKGANTELDR